MGFNFLPRQDQFFVLFDRQADLLLKAAAKFRELMENYQHLDRLVLEIKEIEHQADIATHEIFDLLNRSFLTPIDPEDIHALASCLDDVLDEIEGVAARFQMFHVKAPTPEAVQLSIILESASKALGDAVRCLRDVRKKGRDAILPHLIEINNRENEADDLTRRVVSELFAGNTDILDLIKWKEIYTRLEHATDRAEDVSNVLENIVVKNS